MLQAKAEYEVPVESPNGSDQNPRYVQMSVGLISVSTHAILDTYDGLF